MQAGPAVAMEERTRARRAWPSAAVSRLPARRTGGDGETERERERGTERKGSVRERKREREKEKERERERERWRESRH